MARVRRSKMALRMGPFARSGKSRRPGDGDIGPEKETALCAAKQPLQLVGRLALRRAEEADWKNSSFFSTDRSKSPVRTL